MLFLVSRRAINHWNALPLFMVAEIFKQIYCAILLFRVSLCTFSRGINASVNRNPASSIAKHLLMEGHIVDQDQALRVLLRNSQPRLLAFYEALLIRLHSPALCAQKHLK